MSNRDNVHGEGNYEASRQYNEATKRFVESGKVDEAAQKAKPGNAAEARDLENAEAKGKSRAKEEDPALRGDAAKGESQGDPSSTKGPSAGQSGREGTDASPEQPRPPMPGKE
jgi:hypothetical protein